jgi:hypothetical protein
MLVAGFSPNLTLLPRLILVPGHFAAGHDLIPVAVQFIHLLFLLLQVTSCPQSFTCSQQFLSHAGKLLSAHMGGVPSSLAIPRLEIGHHLQLFDGGTQLLLLHSTFVRITAGAGYWSRSSASARSLVN